MEDMRQGTCPLCKHNKIIRGWPTQFGLQHTGTSPAFPVMALGGHARWTGQVDMQGALYSCVCQRCGYAQWFALEPEKIPLDDQRGNTLLVGPAPAGPYR
jgi:hypothetical protein